jgi:hypothetical protein
MSWTPKPRHAPKVDNPFEESRRLTNVLTLLADINTGGRQVTTQSPDPMITSLERTQPAHRLAINGLAILLVHKNEVIATTTPDSNYYQNSVFRDDSMRPASDLQSLAIQEADPIPESVYDYVRIVDFIVLPNPERPKPSSKQPDSIWGKTQDGDYMVIPPGKSCWATILITPWSQV